MEEIRWNDVFVDCIPPVSSISSVTVDGRSVTVTATATDVGIGMDRVMLYYRYSEDNATWDSWHFYGEMSGNYTWYFDALPDGYYEFYTVGYDLFGNHEPLPTATTEAKARCIIDYPWDINEDGRVNVNDVYIIILHWMQTPADPGWYARADVNSDDIINTDDVLALIAHWTG